jgi:copper chaperone CopZ
MTCRAATRFSLTIAVAALVLGAVATAAFAASTDQATIRVEGMTCPGCEATVESVLSGVDGVTAAEADRRTETAVAAYDPRRTGPQQLVEAINSQTYYVASLRGAGSAQPPRDDVDQATTVAGSSEQGAGPGYAVWALGGLGLAIGAGLLARTRHSS